MLHLHKGTKSSDARIFVKYLETLHRYSFIRRLLSLFFSSFFYGRTGTDVAERRASTVGRTLKVLKGCILQQQSVMRARASGTSRGAEGGIGC